MERTKQSIMNKQLAREHLFNYNMELYGIRNQYARSTSKIEQDQLRHRLKGLLHKMDQDQNLIDAGVNVRKYFTCLETKDFVTNLSKVYELMISTWEELSACNE